MKNMSFFNWNLRTKIFLSFFLVLLFVASFAALVIKNYGSVISLYNDINTRYYQTEKYAKELTYRILDRQACIRGYLLTGKASYLIGYDDDEIPIKTLLTKLKALHVNNPKYRSIIGEFQSTIDEWEYKIATAEIDRRQYLDYGLISNAEFASSVAKIDELGRSCLRKLKDITRAMVHISERDIVGKYHEAYLMGNETRILIILVAVGSILLSAIVGVLLSNHLTAPLATLVESTDLFALGDFSKPVSLRRTDEFGRMALSVDHMRRELKGNMEAIKRSEQRFSLLVQNVNDGIILIQDMKYIFVNRKFCQITGYEEHELIGKDFYTSFGPESAELVKGIYEKRIMGEDNRSIYDTRIVRKDGAIRYVEVNAVVADFENKKADFAVVRDITEKRANDERIRKLSEEVVKTQEEERRRISRELHDEVGQCLSAINLYVEKIEMEDTRLRGVAFKALGDIRGLVNKTVDEIQRITYGLRPYLLDDLGLFPALQWQMDRFHEQTGVHTALRIQGRRRDLPLVIETLIYRTIQEGLTNVRKHAKADKVEIELSYLSDSVAMRMRDDGRGFEMDKQKRKVSLGQGGLGITSIRERLVLCGGHLRMRSAPGQGTELVIRMPAIFSPA